MKKKLAVACIMLFAIATYGQDFSKYATTAQTSYSGGKLEDAHFALQQMLVELDLQIGKEVLKLLPAKMDTMQANTAQDNTTANIGFLGATIHRVYGKGTRQAELEIINNSPLIGTLNTFLNNPMMKMGTTADNKIVKVQGYKARLMKENDGQPDAGYRIEIPLNNALITFKVPQVNESGILSMANTLPLDEIAKLIK